MHIRILSSGHACIKEKKETLSIRPQAGVFRDCQPRFYQYFFKKARKKIIKPIFFCLTFSPCLVYYRAPIESKVFPTHRMNCFFT